MELGNGWDRVGGLSVSASGVWGDLIMSLKVWIDPALSACCYWKTTVTCPALNWWCRVHLEQYRIGSLY